MLSPSYAVGYAKFFQQHKNFVAPKLQAVYGAFVIQNCYAICTALLLIRGEATLTGFETDEKISQTCAISTETCATQHVKCVPRKSALCTIRANKRTPTVRFCPKSCGLQRAGRQIASNLRRGSFRSRLRARVERFSGRKDQLSSSTYPASISWLSNHRALRRRLRRRGG
jgi:hypothetical protein